MLITMYQLARHLTLETCAALTPTAGAALSLHCLLPVLDCSASGAGGSSVLPTLPICRPHGTVRLSITATHMQHVKPEQDGMSDVSFMSSIGRQSASSFASSGTNLLDTDQVWLGVLHVHLYIMVLLSTLPGAPMLHSIVLVTCVAL